MADLSSRTHAYQIALALNNIGITLLEQNCFTQARKTFHDAMHVIQASFLPSSNQSKCYCSAKSKDKKLSNARQRLMHPELEQAFSPLTVAIQVLTYDSTLLTGFQTLIPSKLDSHCMYTFFPLRIEMVDAFRDDLDYRQPDLESSIMVANFGIANFLLALQQSHTPSRYLQIAETCFNMAYSIVERETRRPCDVYSPTRLTLALIMVSGNLQLGHECKQTLKYFQTRYAELRNQIEVLFKNEVLFTSRVAPAA